MIVPVILSGGSGTRLWPLSTPARPKQFLSLVGEQSLFHQTLGRVGDRQRYAAPVVIANAAHEELCKTELAGEPDARLILEPMARNTAVAIVMAAAVIEAEQPDAVLLVMPSDHLIADEDEFHRAVARGLKAAASGLLVTFGIHPEGPETGYGYLQAGDRLTGLSGVRSVARFKEKPTRQAAQEMLSAGDHFWNGGIFMFRADQFLTECRALAPKVYESGIAAIKLGADHGTVISPHASSLVNCPNISVDYAVMEASRSVAVVPLNCGWSDIGSWDAIADLYVSDAQHPLLNVHDSANCFVRTDGIKVSLLGVDDLIVVGAGDQIVIMKRGRSQDIKQLATSSAGS